MLMYVWFWPTLSNFGREITIYTVVCGAYLRFWPTLRIYVVLADPITVPPHAH